MLNFLVIKIKYGLGDRYVFKIIIVFLVFRLFKIFDYYIILKLYN